MSKCRASLWSWAAVSAATVICGCSSDSGGGSGADSGGDSGGDSGAGSGGDSGSSSNPAPGNGGDGGGTTSRPAEAVCGNARCEASENCRNCAEDCGACSSPTALCEGLVTDTEPHPMPDIDPPEAGGRLRDPSFRTTIVRVTDVGDGNVVKPMYSTIQAWNADESLLILYHVDTGHHLYDGRSYEHLRALDINPADLEQVYWDTSNPDQLMYVDADDSTLIRYHVSADRKETVFDFSSCDGQVSSGADPMFSSWDSKVFGLRCDDGTVFAYSVDAGRMSPVVESDSETAPQPAPSGSLFYFDGDVLDENLERVRTLDLADPENHASLGQLADGRDTYNAVAFDPGESCDYGALVVYELASGKCRTVVGESNGYPYPPSGIHVSALAYKNPGWVALSVVGESNGEEPLNQELLLADTNPGGVVCRVAHHHSHGGDGPHGYWAEPHVVISPTGTRLLFGSDWGGRNSVDAYVVELPSYVAP